MLNKTIMIPEASLYFNGPRNGFVFLFDMAGSRFGHMFQPKISSIRKLFRLVEDGCPFKIRAVHILNTVGFLDLILGNFVHFF